LGRGSGSNVDLPANNTSGTNEKTNRKAIVYSTIENILANRERTVKGIINRDSVICAIWREGPINGEDGELVGLNNLRKIGARSGSSAQ
jgi:hypothetical protein